MLDITDKADSTAGATGELTAAEYNDHKNEIQTAVVRSGQALSAGITDQFAKALFINGAGANAASDSGSINSIILSPVTGSTGLTVPNTYAELDGAIFQFEKITANTSTAVTVNFGQTGTELGAKSLVRRDASVPLAGDVNGLCFIQWDNAADKWILLKNGSDTYSYPVAATGTVSPKFANNIIVSDTSVSLNTITLSDGVFHGQKVTTICDGSGLTYIKGTGLYLGASSLGIPISDTLKSTVTWDDNLSAWVADNEITCELLSVGDSEEITQYSCGRMMITYKLSYTVASQNATHPVTFASDPSVTDSMGALNTYATTSNTTTLTYRATGADPGEARVRGVY